MNANDWKTEPIKVVKVGLDEMLDIRKYNKAIRIFQVMRKLPIRRLIQVMNEMGPSTVTDLYVKLRWDQPITSQHLHSLRTIGVAVTERAGKNIYYCLDYDRLERIYNVGLELAGMVDELEDNG